MSQHQPVISRLLLVAASSAFFPFMASAEGTTHADYSASVATYKPLQGFNHVVGSRQFVGYFLAAKESCAVTVINAAAGDDRLIETPERRTLSIPAGGRVELKADHGKALGVACTADADAIKVAPLETNALASR